MCDAARQRADELGFKIDLIDVSGPGMNARRLASILSTRGIKGLLLGPIPQPGAYFDLPWSEFFTVAIGYSITAPTFHRACFHQARSMRLHLRALRALGYQRIGLVLSANSDARTDHNFLGAYFAEQHYEVQKNVMKPYISNVFRRDEFASWFRSETPDCIIGDHRHLVEELGALGYSVPGDIGYSALSWSPLDPYAVDDAGIDERWGALGTSAFEMLVELMKNGEIGVPRYSRFVLVEGEWRPGPTVRSVAPVAAGA
jgi:DNA-binding LacI/PurR family transcriptional regulator